MSTTVEAGKTFMQNTTNNFTITPEQASKKPYSIALKAEIATGTSMDLADLSSIRIYHPEIIAYKARLIAGIENASEYADWTRFLMPQYGPRKRCLSLGSGLGRIEKFLIEIGFAESFDTIELCAYENDGLRIHDERINVNPGDLNFVHLQNESYDFILCHGVLHHLINVEHVLDQLNRALTSSGILLIYEYIGDSRWQFTSERLAYLRAAFPGTAFKLLPLWSLTGFESLRSADLLPLIKHQFGDTCELSVLFGGIYFPFVTCTNPSEDIRMKEVVSLDDKTSREDTILPCYHIGLYRKSTAEPNIAQPWSDEELRNRLFPPVPFSSRILMGLKASAVGIFLRLVKRTITRRIYRHKS